MLLLVIIPAWAVLMVLVAGLCAAARLGDAQAARPHLDTSEVVLGSPLAGDSATVSSIPAVLEVAQPPTAEEVPTGLAA
jgi:hypothetical protein